MVPSPVDIGPGGWPTSAADVSSLGDASVQGRSGGEALAVSYAACQAAYSNADLVPGVRRLSQQVGVVSPTAGRFRTLLWSDGAEHAALRKVVSPWFTPRRVTRLRTRVEALVESVLGDIDANGEADVVPALTQRVPGSVFCAMVGAPESLADQLFRLSEDVLKVFSYDPAAATTVAAASAELLGVVQELIAVKHAEPGDDLTSMMLAAVGERFTLADVGSMIFEMLAASTDNTAHSLAAGLHLLAQHPDEYSRLRGEPSLVPSAVHECGRVEPRVRLDFLVAERPTTVLDTELDSGTLLGVSVLAANLDATVYPDPERFDISRPPKPHHLGFGAGRHYCLGASLARMEMEVVIGAVARRWAFLEPIGQPEIVRDNNTHVRCLPLRWGR